MKLYSCPLFNATKNRLAGENLSNYTLTQAEFKRLKTKLTRAINSKNHTRIIQTVDEAMTIFDEKGSPDDWSRWNRAKEDALVRQRYE